MGTKRDKGRRVKWDERLIERLQVLYDGGLSNPEIAVKMGLTRNQVEHGIHRFIKRNSNLMPDDEVNRLNMFSETFNKSLKLSGDWIIACDFHFPYCRFDFVQYMLKIAKKNGIKNLLCVGDFFEFKFLSSWEDLTGEKDTEKCLQTGEIMMNIFSRQFKKAILLRGNHEERFIRACKYDVRMQSLVRLINNEIISKKIRLDATDYGYVELDNWRITHPVSGAKKGRIENILKSLLDIHRKNIICAHTHRSGIIYSDDGRLKAICVGGFVDENKLWWRAGHDSTSVKWVPSFAMYKNRKMMLYDIFDMGENKK